MYGLTDAENEFAEAIGLYREAMAAFNTARRDKRAAFAAVVAARNTMREAVLADFRADGERQGVGYVPPDISDAEAVLAEAVISEASLAEAFAENPEASD